MTPSAARGLAVAAVLALAAEPLAATASSETGKPSASVRTLACPDARVTVRGGTPADASLACEGARDAIVFLAAQGLAVGAPIRIDIAPKMPEAAGRTALGCYLEAEQRVVVLPFASFRSNRTWMGIAADTRAYRSVVTHEVAHAVGACNYKQGTLPIAAKEYIAYVTMLATMEPGRRGRVLAAFPDPAFEGNWQMNTVVYLFDPHRFAVRAYRHYLQPGNGRDFLQAVVRGTAIPSGDD